MRSHKFWFIAACIALCGVTFAGSAAETRYPGKPVRMLVPFSPGSQTDLFARIMSAKLGEALGQQFVVNNRPSARKTASS